MAFTISINDEAAFEVLFAGPAGPTGPQGPQGPQGVPGEGVPLGGTAGQVLAKVDGVDYNTEWITPQDEYAVWGGITGTLSDQLDLQAALDGKYPTTNPSGFITSSALVGYATESFVTSQGYITSSALTPYLTISSAESTYQPLSGMSAYLTKAGNLSGLTNLATARSNLDLGTLNSPTFAGLSIQGSGANISQLTSTALTISQAGTGQFSIQPSSGITFPDTTIQTTAFSTSVLAPYALINSQVFTGTPSLPTGTIGVTQPTLTSSTQLATTAFVQQELAAGTAVAKNLEVLVRNQTGSTLPAGSVVYISGATGNLPLVTLAQGNNDANSAQTMGFVKTSIANNGQGFVIVRGLLENINTSAYAEGVQLYLSPTTPGAWTTTKPVAPQHMVYIGIVIRSHPTQGSILVAVQNGLELEELHDVLITTPTNGQVLKYDSVSGLWKNGTDVGGVAWGGITGTLSSQTDLQSALDGKYSTSNPSGFITSAALSPYLTSATAAATYQTLSGMSSYLTTSAAASTYAPIATGVPTGGTAGQVLAKIDGTDYNTEWVAAGGGGTTYGLRFSEMDNTSHLITAGDVGKLFVASNNTLTFPSASDDPSFPSVELTIMSAISNNWANFTASPGANVIFKNGISQMYGEGVVKAICFGPGNWLVYGDLSWIPNNTVIQSSCVMQSGYDQAGYYHTGSWYNDRQVWNGSGGITDESGNNNNGCYYPSGYYTEVTTAGTFQTGFFDDDGYAIMAYYFQGFMNDGQGGGGYVNPITPAYGFMVRPGMPPFYFSGVESQLYSQGNGSYYVGPP